MSYKRNIFLTVLLGGLLSLSSCGFTLRGNFDFPSDIKKISVSSNEYSNLVETLNMSFQNEDIMIVSNADKDLNRIIVVSETFNRRQLSINISGRVNEYELIYKVVFQISTPNSKSSNEEIILYRDYSFDEDNIMGNTDREEKIRKEMVSTASSLIYNKFIAKISNTK